MSSTGPSSGPGLNSTEQTVAVVVGKLEVMLTTVLVEVREIATRMRSVELTQAAHEARIASLETERRDATTRRPSWWAVAGGLAAVVTILTGLLVLGGILYGGN
jgi:hypothetical protein